MTKAIILAAGRGSRLNQLTADQPKCMTTIRGRSLLDLELTALNDAGIHDIAIVTGYKKEKIQDQRICKKFENQQWQHSNMVTSLLTADEWLSNDTCIISYSDIFYEPTAPLSLIQSSADFCITYDTHFLSLWSARFSQPINDLETFKLDKQNRVIEIGNKPATLDEIEGQFMGLLKITPSAWLGIKSFLSTYSQDEINRLDMTSLLSKLIHHMQLTAIPFDGSWGEVDHPSDIALYEQLSEFKKTYCNDSYNMI